MKICKALMLCVCISGISQVSYALPMVQKAACVNDAASQCATGVTGVDILGSLYDVIFSQDSFVDLWQLTLPTFWGDPVGAETAVAALSSVLNVSNISGLIGNPSNATYLFVPYDVFLLDGDLILSAGGRYNTGDDFAPDRCPVGFCLTSPDLSLVDASPQQYLTYAVFTPSGADVPAPPILALFGLGLVGISLSRRKRSLPAV